MLLDSIAVERSTFLVVVQFYDESGAAVSPDVATWTLTNGAGEVIHSRSRVTIESPSAEEEIVLSGLDLVKETDRKRELRILTVEWEYDSGKTAKEEARFYVKELVGI